MKAKILDYSHSLLDLGVKLSRKPHHETFPLLKQSKDADCGWWIPKLIQRAHVPSCSFLPLHCSHCCANRSICAAAWWKAAGNWSSQRVICWKDGGVGGRSYTDSVLFKSSMHRNQHEWPGSSIWHCFRIANWITAWGEDPFYPLSQQALSAECQISFKTSCHPKLGELV